MLTPSVKIRNLFIGGEHPIAIQSMTNTDTSGVRATAKQCLLLAASGAELVRMAITDEDAARAISEIRRILDDSGRGELPLIGDFHFNGHVLLSKIPACAKTLDKYRINPGNEKDFERFIRLAIEYDKPVRIGVNAGSTEENPVSLALKSCEKAEELGLSQNKIVVSVKTANVLETIKSYEELAAQMAKNRHFYAIHAGLTEAGSGIQAVISSSAALAILLQKGIGDTIRMSFTPTPGQSRNVEVEACKALLQALNLRNFRPQVISCPGCSRTDSNFYIELAEKINKYIDQKIQAWQKKFPHVLDLKIAVMGCVVNGPGEAKNADIAICLPGKNEKKTALVYVNGKLIKTLTGANIAKEFLKILEDYIKSS